MIDCIVSDMITSKTSLCMIMHVYYYIMNIIKILTMISSYTLSSYYEQCVCLGFELFSIGV